MHEISSIYIWLQILLLYTITIINFCNIYVVISTYIVNFILYKKHCNNSFIQDINDNAPVFEEPFYAVTVTENTRAGTLLTTVSAMDIDIDRNGQVVYSTDLENPLVEVDNTTGQVVLTDIPDYEVIQAFVVEV